jgi:hypothetical protein
VLSRKYFNNNLFGVSMKFSSLTRGLAVVIVLMITAFAVTSAASLHCWVKINGSWVYGTILSDKDIGVKNGVATVQPPWAFVGDDGKTVLSSPDKPATFEISIFDPNGQKKMNYNLTISDMNGVSISSSEPISISVYDLENGTFVFTKENDKAINMLPNTDLKYNKLYIGVIIDKNGNTETVKFTIGDKK